MSTASATCVTDVSHGSDFFRFYEGNEILGEKVWDVLQGKLVGAMFRGVIPEELCEKVTKNFWNNLYLDKRGDQAPAHYVVRFHFGKKLDAYFEELEKTRKGVQLFFKDTLKFFESFIDKAKAALVAEVVEFRPARYEGKEAGHCLMRSWAGEGSNAFSPYDDVAKCSIPNRRDLRSKKPRIIRS